MYTEIRDRLLELERVDQQMREGMPSVLSPAQKAEWDAVDSFCTAGLKMIINEVGWPTVSKVGEEAAQVAWLIAQHADRNIPFQKFCLELMCKESQIEVDEIDIAYLHDRICVNEGHPQFFGTQFNDNEYGAYGPEPIELPEFVNERRKVLGLRPLYEYKQELIEKYKKW